MATGTPKSVTAALAFTGVPLSASFWAALATTRPLLPLTTALLSHRYDLHTVTLSNRYRYAVTRPPPFLRRYELTTVSLSTVTVRPPLRLGHR